MKFLPYFMVYAGSLLMAFNIFQYIRFSRAVRKTANWDQERRILNFPIILLILFLAGYLAVGLFGAPDVIMGSILFGGTIFVSLMLWLVRRTVDKIRENEHLESKLLAAEEASKAKSFFLSNMSHDLRTPINAITGYTNLAKRAQTSDEERLDYINKIEKSSQQLVNIVNDVLEMSRLESGKVEVNPSPGDLEECVSSIGDLFKFLLAEKKISFSSEYSIEDRWVLFDKGLIDRVLMNLLSNAGKFTEENGSVFLGLKELSSDGNEGKYELRVRDTGIGMSPEFVDHLFSAFERERTSTVSKTQGTGLGMAITKKIIDKIGGNIDVVTEKGKGTEFIVTFTFPFSEPETPEQKTQQPELRFDGKRVLLVEDNEINMEIARLMLSQAGFQVETAENGQIGFEKLALSEHGYFDVVLMDIQMPVMDGYSASRAIRALPDRELSKIPIIAVTANAFQEDIQSALDAGMNGHIAKPLDNEQMLCAIKEILDRQNA